MSTDVCPEKYIEKKIAKDDPKYIFYRRSMVRVLQCMLRLYCITATELFAKTLLTAAMFLIAS